MSYDDMTQFIRVNKCISGYDQLYLTDTTISPLLSKFGISGGFVY